MSDRPTPGHDDRQGAGYGATSGRPVPAGDGADAFERAAEALAYGDAATDADREDARRCVAAFLEGDGAITPWEARALLHKLGGLTDYSRTAVEAARLKLVAVADAPKSAAPRGEAPKKEGAVDWRVRSQGLEETGKNIRFWLGKLVDEAEVLGDEMDAPVKWRTEIQGVTHTALRTFLARYDEALSLGLPDEEGEGRCPTCDGTGPDKVDRDFDSGMLEAECGDEWHDRFSGQDVEAGRDVSGEGER